MIYPPARRDDSVTDTLHGELIQDPYRWLEDPDAEETQQFVAAQNELAESILGSCDTRQRFREQMTLLYNYGRYGCPFKYGDKVFYFFNSGLQAQSVLYKQASLDAEPEVLLDPNLLSEDGTVALRGYAFSEDGRHLAYGLSASGSDWQTIHVMDVDSKEKHADVLKWVKFSSMAWTHDHKGFFYNRYPEPKKGGDLDAGTETDVSLHQKLFYHTLGTEQVEDVLCWEDPANPEWMFGAEVSDDGRYLLMSISSDCDPVNKLYYTDLEALPSGGVRGHAPEAGLLPFHRLVDTFEAQYEYVTNDGRSFTFQTNRAAPRSKLARVDLDAPEAWADLVPQSDTDVLEWARCVRKDLLLVCYLHDVKNVLQVRRLEDGSLQQELPLDIGAVSSSSGKKKDTEIFYSFTSFLSPGTIFRCDLTTEPFDPKVFRQIEVKGFDAGEFETKQLFVTSKDGTRVPMFVIAKKGIQLDGSHPALLYGYGGFNISITPSFSISRVVLMRHIGAVVAVANLRGGGEYGEDWHKAGSLARKQNVFDDFHCCAERLVSEGYTQPSKLCIEGHSNGGLLIAACINQRPELYGCAIPHVGVMDMLRFHKFTIGHAWTSDYGCADKEEEFRWLMQYSPLHNVRRPWEEAGGTGKQYPATMVLTGDHDDRVSPLHSLKLVATLQHVLFHSVQGDSPQTNPIIARVETKAGHGAGRPTKKVIEEVSDVFAFVAKVTGATWID